MHWSIPTSVNPISVVPERKCRWWEKRLGSPVPFGSLPEQVDDGKWDATAPQRRVLTMRGTMEVAAAGRDQTAGHRKVPQVGTLRLS